MKMPPDVGIQMILFVMLTNAFTCVMGWHKMRVFHSEHMGQGPGRKKF